MGRGEQRRREEVLKKRLTAITHSALYRNAINAADKNTQRYEREMEWIYE